MPFFFHVAKAQDKNIGIGVLISSNQADAIQIFDVEGKILGSLIQDEYENSILDNFNYQKYGFNVSRSAFIDYGNEKYGLPILNQLVGDSLDVLVCIDQNDNEIVGKVHLDNNGIIFLWRDILNDKPVFFRQNSNRVLYEEIGNVEINLDHNVFEDYIMRPIEVSENWMKVRLITPSNYCKSPKELKEIIGWIKFVDDEMNPLVFFYPRGC